MASALLLAACETMTGGKTSGPATPAPTPAAPRYNLTGYPDAFKQGYTDACATPRRRSTERIKSDADYSMGWNDGSAACRSR